MEIKSYFGKKGLDEIIRYVNKYNVEKEINLRKTDVYYAKDGFSTYLCFYPCYGFSDVEYFSKSELLYLQEHGFVFKNENGEIENVETLED